MAACPPCLSWFTESIKVRYRSFGSFAALHFSGCLLSRQPKTWSSISIQVTGYFTEWQSSGYWVFYGMAIIGCLVYKFKAKDVHRPYKTFVITPVLLCILSVAIVISGLIGQPLGTGICWLWIVSSLMVYYIFFYKKFLLCKCLGKINDFLQYRCKMVPCQ